MKHILLCSLALAIFLVACQSEDCTSTYEEWKRWMTPDGRLKVLSTTAMVSDIVQAVGGEWVDSETLIQGELDPHSYQLVKGDGEKLAFADLIFYNGLGLEHGPSLLHQLKNHPHGIPLGDLIEQQERELILFIDGQRDPHIWMDLSIWKKIIPFIVQALSEQDPDHASDYQRQGEKTIKKLEKEHLALKKRFEAVSESRRYLVTSHDAFNYFARAYLATEKEKGIEEWGVRFQAPEGLAPESQLSATDIQAILDHVQKYQIEVLFPETNVSRDSIHKILSSGKYLGLKLRVSDQALFGDAMGCPGSGGETYLGMMRTNAETLIRNWQVESHATKE